jgi:hypothetical protein
MGTKRKGVADKNHSSPTPAETKAKKELFIKALATGRAPGCAAEAVGIARSTAYAWKAEDAAVAIKLKSFWKDFKAGRSGGAR